MGGDEDWLFARDVVFFEVRAEVREGCEGAGTKVPLAKEHCGTRDADARVV